MNEEFDGSYSEPNKEYYQNINDYNQIFVDTVRKTGDNNTKRWLIIPAGTQILTIPPEITVLNFLRINTATNQSIKKNNEL